MTNKTLIIAEIGVNHNGNLNLARQLVDVAVEAGADAVKFQTFKAERLATTNAPKAAYQIQNTDQQNSQFEMLKQLELTPQMHDVLLKHCEQKNIHFLSTAFDLESLHYLAKLGLERFKIPSGEITNLPYLRCIGGLGKPIILSTGMATLGDIEGALAILNRAGARKDQITVLHCTTEYPTSMCDVNLKAMCSIREAFGVAVGYSDHTLGIEVPIAAVALGATIVEKHLTLNRNLSGPDHKSSAEPDEFVKMVRAIRNIEQSLGDGIKRVTASESLNKVSTRKSIVASKTIQAGERFTSENITTKRPGTGISPMRWEEVIDRPAKRRFAPDELIEL